MRTDLFDTQNTSPRIAQELAGEAFMPKWGNGVTYVKNVGGMKVHIRLDAGAKTAKRVVALGFVRETDKEGSLV